MASYHQMGHDSINLLSIDGYSGAILSPVNLDVDKAKKIICDNSGNLDFIFDSQLYYPRSQRGQLHSWPHYPKDFETQDMGDINWWHKINSNIIQCCEDLKVKGICSPIFAPPQYNNDYYGFSIAICDDLVSQNNASGWVPIQTALIHIPDLSMQNKALEISSILSTSRSKMINLIFVSDIEPRREYYSSIELTQAMKLIHLLKSANYVVIISCCSSDMVLWKAAGADICSTGKFFNLRRFTKSRFEEPESGGGQLAYYFDESFMAFFREGDVIRLFKAGLLAKTSNPYAIEILDCYSKGIQLDKPIAKSWRQYLFSFADLEKRISTKETNVSELLREAEKKWKYLEDNDVLLEEVRNDGSWIRPWRIAVNDFKKETT